MDLYVIVSEKHDRNNVFRKITVSIVLNQNFVEISLGNRIRQILSCWKAKKPLLNTKIIGEIIQVYSWVEDSLQNWTATQVQKFSASIILNIKFVENSLCGGIQKISSLQKAEETIFNKKMIRNNNQFDSCIERSIPNRT